MSQHEWTDFLNGTSNESRAMDALRLKYINLQSQLIKVTKERDKLLKRIKKCAENPQKLK